MDPTHWTRVVVNHNPREDGAHFTEVGLPVDDLRQTAASPHKALGLLDNAP